MKSLTQIKEELKAGDIQHMAETLGLSKSLVSQVLNKNRRDRHNIQLAFNIMLSQRLNLNRKLKRLNTKESNT